jgi:hypothetical protein
MASSAPPNRPPPAPPTRIGEQEWEKEFDELLTKFDELKAEERRLTEIETLQFAPASEGGPEIVAVNTDQIEVASYETVRLENQGVVSPKTEPPLTITNRRLTPPPSTTTTTTTTTQRTTEEADPRASVGLPEVPDISFEEDTDERQTITRTPYQDMDPNNLPRMISGVTVQDMQDDENVFLEAAPLPKEKPPLPDKPERFRSSKIVPPLDLSATTGTEEKSKPKVNMFPEFKHAQPKTSTPRKSQIGHKRRESDQQGKGPTEGTTKLTTHRRVVTDLPRLASEEARLPSPRSEAKSPRKPLPKSPAFRLSMDLKKQGSAKPSERPDIVIDPLTPSTPREREPSVPTGKRPDPGREKPGNQ